MALVLLLRLQQPQLGVGRGRLLEHAPQQPADFMHLMLTLRESEASRYTERDTPIFVGRKVGIREALDLLDGAAVTSRAYE